MRPNLYPAIYLQRDRKYFIASLCIIFCIISSLLSTKVFSQPTLNYSYSYLNLTRNNGGGTLETGDVIEVHVLINVVSGSTISNVYFIAPITTGTQYVANSMKIITNEGVLYAAYDDLSGNDAGVYDGAVPGIRINVGTITPATIAGFYSTTGGGVVNGGDVPIGGGGTIGIVAYQLIVTASYGATINPTGTFYYSYAGGTKSKPKIIADSVVFDSTTIKVVQNQGLCTNFSSASFTAESSFGSGTTQNRAVGVNAPGYTKVNIGANAPQDGYYSVVNNTSADGTTNNSVPYAPSWSPSRVFNGVWDIIGDHTGAANTATGNPPVAPGKNGGYMLVVNANIATGVVYNDLIKNVCPNTYYEFSVWMRNICGKCGADQNGKLTYQPGIKPNLTFTVNNIDYYTTGDIPYTQTWVKRGFIYKTGPAESSFQITIKNNAAGGGGNDWALDDINLATCYPNLTMNPNDTAKVCVGYSVTITDTVSSYFNNYGNYQWEASADGNTWVSVKIGGGAITPGLDPHSITPVLVNGLYQYYVDASFIPVALNNGYYLRLKVATTTSNLTNASCSVDKSQRVYLKVYTGNCSVLNSKILNFGGSTSNGKNVLQWNITDVDNEIKEYEIEKSADGIHFNTVGVVNTDEAKNDNYTFTDPENTSNVNYYRLKLISQGSNALSYSKTIMLYNRAAIFKISTVNPFRSNLKVTAFLPEQGKLEMNLYDMYGKSLIKKTVQLGSGSSEVIFDNISNLPSGMYILTAFHNGVVIQNKLIKSN
ncbi:MAG TPA: T9SS type A sorting domain-containing protein [Hanamia sp.]